MNKYLLSNKVLPSSIFILLIVLLSFGYKYYADTALVSKTKEGPTELYETYTNKPYKFEDFSTTFSSYKITEVKFEGDYKLEDNPNYWNDWKNIFADVGDSKFDFAGHYKLTSAGNGTMKDLYLVDGLTGKIYAPSGMMATGPSTYIYKNNSKLLVLVMDNSFGFISETKENTVYFYYTLNDDKSFKLLGTYVYKDNKFIKVIL